MANPSIFSAFERMWQHVLALVGSKANINHNHDDIYYTEAEIESKLDNKADSNHNHNNSYEAKGTVESELNLHNTSTDAHNDVRILINDISTKLNNFLNVDDTTKDQLSEIISLIEENADDIESITSGKVNVSDIVNNLTTNVSNKPLSAAQGVEIKSLIDALTDVVNGKADKTELPTKVSELSNDSGYLTSSTTPIKSVNGKTGAVSLTASDVGADASGSANAVQSNLDILNDEFDDHVADTGLHVTNAKQTNWNSAYTHSTSTHARVDATNVAKSNTNGNIVINGTETVVYAHPTGTNPHGTTKADVGLGNVDNTSDTNKPVSTAQKAAIDAVQTNVNTLDDKVDDHIDNADIHFTAEERTKLSGIATGANKYTHPTSGVSAGTYKSVTVDANGHVTGGSNPTTLSGYGITDAEAKGTVNTHNTATDAHNDIRTLISNLSTKVNNFLNVNDTTKDQLSEIIALIEENADDIESITSGKVNVSDIVNNLTTNVSNKPLSAAQGVEIKSLIDALRDDLNTDVGNLSTHTGNTTVHITSTERTNWNDAYAKKHEHDNKSVLDNTTASYTITEQAKLSGIKEGAEVNQNAFSNVKVGSTTVAADSKTDTIEFVGSNVTITPDATNDKVTFAVANGTTSAVGIVKLTDSVSSEDTTTAATPKNVKAAYDLANTAKTNAATAQATADGKADKGHKHTASEITDLTVTATELNYMDGVTSNVQTQLDSLDSNSIKSELVDVVEGEEPTMSTVVANKIAELEARIASLEAELSNSVARLSNV